MIPPPLCYTNGYKGDEKMMGFIKEAGLKTPARPAGNQRKGAPIKAAVNNKNTHTPQIPRERRPKEAKAAARRLELSSDEDITEEERRARRYLEAKKKLGKIGNKSSSSGKENNSKRRKCG